MHIPQAPLRPAKGQVLCCYPGQGHTCVLVQADTGDASFCHLILKGPVAELGACLDVLLAAPAGIKTASYRKPSKADFLQKGMSAVHEEVLFGMHSKLRVQ